MAKLRVIFYCNASGREPVRDWLRSLDRRSKKIIGDDIKTVQHGWPLVKIPRRDLEIARRRAAELRGGRR